MRKKFKIAYAEDFKDIRDLVGTVIEGELDCELVEFTCGNDLIAYLQVHTDVDLVLTDYNMPNGSGGDVYSYLKEGGNKIPCVLMSSDAPEDHGELSDFYETNKHNYSVAKPFDIDELLQFIKKLFPVERDRDYKPVKVKRFLNLKPVSVNIYIQLSGEKYIKLLNQNEVFHYEQIQRYIADKDFEFFYVKSNEFNIFMESFSEQLESVLTRKSLKLENRLGAELSGVAFIHEICNELGINQSTIDTVDAITKSTLTVIKKKNPGVFKELMKMMSGEGFLYSHSLLLSYLSCEIAQRMQWSSPALYQKLSIAAILHDVGLSEEISKYNKVTDSMKNDLRHRDLKLIKEHPQQNYELVRDIDSFPSDVGTLIVNHHERPDGSGFPRGLSSLRTSPLSCTFILAHEFVHQLFENECDCSKAKGILNSLNMEFNVGNYKKPFEGLTEIVNG